MFIQCQAFEEKVEKDHHCLLSLGDLKTGAGEHTFYVLVCFVQCSKVMGGI